jgi:hypothetical protein
MTHFRIVAEFDTDPEPFWKIFFHEPYNTDLYQRIEVKENTLLYTKEDETTIKFSRRVIPKRDLPGVIKKIVGGDLGYTETSTFHKGKNLLEVKIEPSLMKEKTKIFGKYTITPIAPGKVRRVFEGDIDVSIPLVGGRVEKAIIEDMTKSYDVAAQVTREWIKKGL